MLVLRDRLIQTPLMSLQTGTQVGITTEPIIDPKNLHIVAFYCEGPLIDFSPALIHSNDIREFSSIGMIINSADDIMRPDELVRLQEIIEYGLRLEGMRVVDEHRHKLGKIVNYTVDVNGYFVVKLHVQPSLLQSFSISEKLIDRSQIVAIKDDEIVVRSAAPKATNKVTIPQPAIHNPFRHPQPEAVKAKVDTDTSVDP